MAKISSAQTLTVTYRKKTGNKATVVRHVGAMSYRGPYLYIQDLDQSGQVKKFIRSRIVDVVVEAEPFKPVGGFKPEL